MSIDKMEDMLDIELFIPRVEWDRIVQAVSRLVQDHDADFGELDINISRCALLLVLCYIRRLTMPAGSCRGAHVSGLARHSRRRRFGFADISHGRG